MEDAKLQLDRRDFMGWPPPWPSRSGRRLTRRDRRRGAGPVHKFTRWLDGIHGKQRILLDMREPNAAWRWHGPGCGSLPRRRRMASREQTGQVMVLRHNAIPIALEDSAWEKYGLGEYFKIEDPETASRPCAIPTT